MQNPFLVEESADRIMSNLHNKVRHHYAEYNYNATYVLPHHRYLFTQRTLDQWLLHSYDSLTCWLQSIEEDKAILSFQEAHL
jgi:hypothetical protein